MEDLLPSEEIWEGVVRSRAGRKGGRPKWWQWQWRHAVRWDPSHGPRKPSPKRQFHVPVDSLQGKGNCRQLEPKQQRKPIPLGSPPYEGAEIWDLKLHAPWNLGAKNKHTGTSGTSKPLAPSGLHTLAFISQNNRKLKSLALGWIFSSRKRRRKVLCAFIPSLIFHPFSKGINDCLYMFPYKNHTMKSHHSQQKSPKCSTWMQSQKRQNDLCLFPRQTIQYQGNPRLGPNQ